MEMKCLGEKEIFEIEKVCLKCKMKLFYKLCVFISNEAVVGNMVGINIIKVWDDNIKILNQCAENDAL